MRCSRPATLTEVESQMKSKDESFHTSGPGTALTHLLESKISGGCRALYSHQTIYSPSGFFRCFLLFRKVSHGILVTLCQIIITANASSWKDDREKSLQVEGWFYSGTAVCKIASGISKWEACWTQIINCATVVLNWHKFCCRSVVVRRTKLN